MRATAIFMAVSAMTYSGYAGPTGRAAESAEAKNAVAADAARRDSPREGEVDEAAAWPASSVTGSVEGVLDALPLRRSAARTGREAKDVAADAARHGGSVNETAARPASSVAGSVEGGILAAPPLRRPAATAREAKRVYDDDDDFLDSDGKKSPPGGAGTTAERKKAPPGGAGTTAERKKEPPPPSPLEVADAARRGGSVEGGLRAPDLRAPAATGRKAKNVTTNEARRSGSVKGGEREVGLTAYCYVRRCAVYLECTRHRRGREPDRPSTGRSFAASRVRGIGPSTAADASSPICRSVLACPDVDRPRAGRRAAAGASWIFRGRVAPPPRVPRGSSARAWIVRGRVAARPRPRRGYSVGRDRGAVGRWKCRVFSQACTHKACDRKKYECSDTRKAEARKAVDR